MPQSQEAKAPEIAQSLQIEVKTNPASLFQGAIFDLAATLFLATEADLEKFKTTIPPTNLERIKAEGFCFSDLYPFTEYDSTADQYGIVVTQTCDLVSGEETLAKLKDGKIVENKKTRYPKVPFINIAILEPFERLFINTLERHGDLDDYYLGLDLGTEGKKFVVSIDKMYSKLFSEEILASFQNDHKHIFFIEIPNGAGEAKILGADLSKLFPIRVEHLGNITKNVKFALKSDFVGALGWKVAELYGRVGLPVYEVKDIIKLDEILRKKLGEIFEDDMHVTSEQFVKIKEKVGNAKQLNDYLKSIAPSS